MEALKISTHYVTALFLALLTGFLYVQNIDYSLYEPGALIGISTFDGMDVSQRIRGFYKMVFLTGISFLTFTFFLKKWSSLIQHKWAFPLSVLGILTVVYSFFNPTIALISVIVLGLLVSTAISLRNETNRLFYILLSVSITLFISYFLRISGAGFNEGFILFIWAFVLFTLIVLDKNSIFGTDVSMLFPLLLLPLIEPLANESFLILNQRNLFLTTPIGWFLIYNIALSIWLIIRYRKRSSATQIQDSKFIYGFVFSIAVFSLYKPFYSFWGDLFELANPANAMMRHFVFGEYPFIDYFSSHVLFEQIPQWFYVLLNGYQADVSFMIYGFFVPVIGVVISFWFFKKLLRTEWALLLVFLFPLTEVLLPPTFIYGLLTIKFLFDYFQNRSAKNLYILLFWILFITLWRIDFGASIIPAVVLIFLLEWAQQKSWVEIKKVVIQAIIFITGLIGLAVIVNLNSSGRLFENLPLALEYLGASQAHAYTELAKKFTLLFYLHYFVFPIISVVIIIQVWIANWKLKSRFDFLEITTLFLGLIYLFNAQRGLVRHSFSEEYDLYISSVFFLFVATWMLGFFTAQKGLKFMVFSFIFILGFHYSNHGKPKSFASQSLTKTVHSPGIKNTQEKINRVIVSEDFDMKGYDLLTNFINVNLKPDQTFIDFSHAPLLYFLTQQKVPSYFNQYMQNMVTPKLLKQNAGSLTNIGMVVLGHSPRNPIDYLDGVPNELRYLPVTEYIYKNFSPFTVVNGYRIWMPKTANYAIEDSLKMLPVMHDNLRNWPNYLGNTTHFETTSEVILSGTDVLLFDHAPNIHDAFSVEFKDIPEGVKHTAWVQYFNHQHKLLGEVEFKVFRSEEELIFVIPVGYQYNWQTKEVGKIEFHYPDYLTIKSIKLVSYEP